MHDLLPPAAAALARGHAVGCSRHAVLLYDQQAGAPPGTVHQHMHPKAQDKTSITHLATQCTCRWKHGNRPQAWVAAQAGGAAQ
jgi:hypothetical protein